MGFGKSDLLRLQQTHWNLRGTFHCGTRLQNYIQDITWKGLWRPKFPCWNLYFYINNLKNTPMCISLLFPPCQKFDSFFEHRFSAQAVSHRLFTRSFEFNSRAFCVVFLVRRLKRDRFFNRELWFYPANYNSTNASHSFNHYTGDEHSNQQWEQFHDTVVIQNYPTKFQSHCEIIIRGVTDTRSSEWIGLLRRLYHAIANSRN